MKFPLSKKHAVAIAAAAATLILIVLIRFALFVEIAPGDGRNVQIFDFEHGRTLSTIAIELQEKQVVSSARLFILYAKLRGDQTRVKAGVYQFNDGLQPGEILRKMVAGEVYARKFAVPEGYSIYQLAELLEGQRLLKKEAFLESCSSRPLLKELGIHGKSVEGYLYPCTYDVSPKVTETDLIRMMVVQFEKVYSRRFAEKVKTSPLSKHQVITLASIVEKEAVVPAERPLIASVFLNRLKAGMPLQSDPTAVYGIRVFGGNVSKQDIMRRTPYNTYLIKELPPGPIGNPSSEAIEAVLNPAGTSYLYFVAKKDGTHSFSSSLQQHNNAVRTYLKQH